MIEAGDWVDVARIDNEPVTLGVEIAKGGESPNMVLAATYSWYWAADVLARAGGLPPHRRRGAPGRGHRRG